MEQPVFPDKSRKPKDADLAEVLGRAKGHRDNLKTHALEANPDAREEWKYYMKKTGWTFRVKGKRHNLLYMQPRGKGRFTVGPMFGKMAVQAAEQSDLPEQIQDPHDPNIQPGSILGGQVTTKLLPMISKFVLSAACQDPRVRRRSCIRQSFNGPVARWSG